MTNAEIAVLKEESYSVLMGEDGFRLRKIYLTFKDAFRLSIEYYFTTPFNESKVDYGDGGWTAMLQGLEIRNRISHPKLTGQLAVTDKELETVRGQRNGLMTLCTNSSGREPNMCFTFLKQLETDSSSFRTLST